VYVVLPVGESGLVLYALFPATVAPLLPVTSKAPCGDQMWMLNPATPRL